MTFKSRAMLACITITLALRSITSAGGFSHEVHPSALSWWRFDPSRFDSTAGAPPERRVFLATIRAAISAGLFGDGTSAKIIEGVLAASDVGAVPHTLSLFAFDAQRPPSGVGIDINELAMVLELHTPINHERYMRTIRAIVVDAERAKTGDQSKAVERQRVIELPDGTQAVGFSLEGWPEWREVSWCSREGSFVIAIGKGALEQRFDAAAHLGESPWASHLSIVDTTRPEGGVFFNAYLDIDQLRDAFPEAFGRGRTPRMMRALGIGSAEQLMLHGRFVDRAGGGPPLLAIDATTVREGEERIRHHPGTRHEWPVGDLPLGNAEGSYILTAPVRWPSFAETMLDIYESTVMDHELWKFREQRSAWRDEHGERFDRVIASLDPWLVITDDPTPLVPIPGLSTLVIPFKQGTEIDVIRADLDALLEPWADVVRASPGGQWTLSIHKSGLVRFPTWSIVTAGDRSVLAAGWGSQVIERVRELLAEPDTEKQSR